GDPGGIRAPFIFLRVGDLALTKLLLLRALADAAAFIGREHLEHHLRCRHHLALAQVLDRREAARKRSGSDELIEPQRERIALVSGARRRDLQCSGHAALRRSWRCTPRAASTVRAT